MWHVLVASEREALAIALRAAAPETAVVLSSSGVDETLDRLGRSARVDAVVTDDDAVERAIREEIPGTLPVVRIDEPEGAMAAWAEIECRLAG